jgi:acyl-ACP thioesterase
VNLKTGKSENPADCPFPIPLFPGKNALPEMMDILDPQIEPRMLRTEQAKYSDLDMNNHVNHCRYVDWVMDSLDADELRSRRIRSIQMNYISQVPLGGKVAIVRFKNTNHHAYIFGMNADSLQQGPDNAICHFQARIGFAD